MISDHFESKEVSEAKWFLNVAQLILSFEHMCDYDCGRYKVHILSYACVCDTFDKTPFSKTTLTLLSFDIHSLTFALFCSLYLYYYLCPSTTAAFAQFGGAHTFSSEYFFIDIFSDTLLYGASNAHTIQYLSIN